MPDPSQKPQRSFVETYGSGFGAPIRSKDGTYSGFDEPAWMKRAKNPNNPSLGRSSVLTGSQRVRDREVLYPTIRMQKDGTLKKYTDKEALDIALANKDYLLFEDPDKATAFSRYLSGRLGEIREANEDQNENENEINPFRLGRN